MAWKYGILCHMKKPVEETRKITVNLPASLIDGLVEREEKSLTEILREALQLYRRKTLFTQLESRRGKVDFGATWQELKHDRE